MSPHKLNVLPSPAALPSYGISENGFLPAISPLVQLPRAYYEPWEKIAQNLPEYLAAGQVRDLVDEMPVLDTSHLATEAEWQRAYSVLAILTQSYVWQGPEPSQVSRHPTTIRNMNAQLTGCSDSPQQSPSHSSKSQPISKSTQSPHTPR